MIELIILFILSFLPVIILGYYTYSQDREKEPKRMLIKLFFGGLVSALLTIIFSIILRMIFPNFNYNFEQLNPIQLIFYTFIMISLVEELSKFIITYLISYHNKEYDQLYDMIVYSVFVSLGFAWIENLIYILDGGISIAISRFLFAVPTHTSVAIFMGYYLSLSKLYDISNNKKLRIKNLGYSILIPTILHGIYDYLAYSNHYILVYFFFIFTCLLFLRAHKKLKQMSLDRTILITKYCPNCGSELKNNNTCKKCNIKISK